MVCVGVCGVQREMELSAEIYVNCRINCLKTFSSTSFFFFFAVNGTRTTNIINLIRFTDHGLYRADIYACTGH